MTSFLLAPPGRRRRHVAARVVSALALAGGLTLAGAGFGVAQAHVRVFPDNIVAGSFAALTFRVPNESPTAGTVKVSVALPTATPFLSVSTRPVAGWTAKTTESPLPKPVEVEGTTVTKAVTEVTWTADQGTQIKAGEYQEFAISAGPLPAPGTILLPATQTYSDGKVVTWDQPTPASGEEPENPAPALVVTAADSGAPSMPGLSPSGDSPSTGAAASAAPTDGQSIGSPTDTPARVLSGVALVVAAAGLVVAVLSRRRRSVDPRP